MFDPNIPESARPVQAVPRDGPDVPAFIGRHRHFFTLLAVVAAQILLLSLQITRNNHVRLIRYWAVEAFDPLERSVGGLMSVVTNAYRTYGHLWRAEQENQELHVQLVAAEAQIQRLGEQAGETQRLRTLLDFKSQAAFQTVAAEVIASSNSGLDMPGGNSKSLTAIFIDKGSDSGLTADLAVITPQGVVGKILAVFPHSAQVLLITDPSSGVGVTLAQSRVQGILKGGNNGLCDVRYVMNEEAVSHGEAVITSGLDQVYPKGLPVGTVTGVGEGNIYKTITAKPAVDLNRLEIVLVVVKPGAAEQQALNGPR
ncbi:MAG TPA: rod shape-determining protein MreC [Terriglobia bacterium]|nr:rod shape-determining protein MreC [Terriglobia bacterium]